MDVWYTLMAMSPVLFALICLLGLKMSSVKTALLAYTLSVFMTILPWKFQIPVTSVGWASIKGFLLSLTVIYVLIFGLFLYNVLYEGGALAALSNVLTRRAKTPVQQALLISAALGPFLEATTGFGIGIVIAAPLYLAMGFEARKTAMLSLLTQSAVPWGALAVGTLLNAELSRVSLRDLGVASALFSLPLYLLYTLAAVVIAGGWAGLRENLPAVLLVWVSLSASTWAANAYLSPPLAGAMAGFATAWMLWMYFRLGSRRGDPTIRPSAAAREQHADLSLWKAFLPYGFLIAFGLVANLSPRLHQWLQTVLVWNIPAAQFQLALLLSPGFALLLASLVGIGSYGLTWTQVRRSGWRALRQVYPVAVSTIGFVAMSMVMQQAGMTDLFSHQLALWVGGGFLLLSPLLGALGGLITGSNAAANAMFAPFQSAMAHELHHSPLLYATIQNVTASNLTMESPSRIALAASITNLTGEEGRLLRRTIPLGIWSIVIVGICGVYVHVSGIWFAH